MNEKSTFIIKVAAVVGVGVCIAFYFFYQARDLIQGPSIAIETPQNGASLATPLLEIKGVASNISSITLNDTPIFVDEEGVFKEKILLSPGYNIIKLSALDKFGRKTEKLLQLIFTPEHESR